MARSLNRVQLIGNLTRDPELRYTPNGTAVCSFGLATNRSWTTDAGEKREETEFHKIVSWSKLAELCSQFLAKGRKVYVEGRLSTRKWTAQDGTPRISVEVVIDDMILLDSRRISDEAVREPESLGTEVETPGIEGPKVAPVPSQTAKKPKKKDEPKEKAPGNTDEEAVNPDDIPF